MKKSEINYSDWCYQCQLREFDPKSGVVCSLTKMKGDFEDECEDFVLDAREEIKQNRTLNRMMFSPKENKYPNINAALTGNSIIMVFFASLFFLLSDGRVNQAILAVYVVALISVFLNSRYVLILQATPLLYLGIMSFAHYFERGFMGPYAGIITIGIALPIIMPFRAFSQKNIENYPLPEITETNAGILHTIKPKSRLRMSRLSGYLSVLNIPIFIVLLLSNLFGALQYSMSLSPDIFGQNSLFLIVCFSILMALAGLVIGILGVVDQNEDISTRISMIGRHIFALVIILPIFNQLFKT